MPSTTGIRWAHDDDSASDSGFSDVSDHSRSTAPTDFSRQPSLKYRQPARQDYPPYWWEDESSNYFDQNPHASVETYASTVPSDEDLECTEDLPPFEVPDHYHEDLPSTAFPSTPSEFAEYFPSSRRLCIRHDDSTLDGNMNLRVDTEVRGPERQMLDLTMFHLRMHDLRKREFSLRRYCRDSGREVCHSSRKYTKPAVLSRPSLQRSMSSALSSIRNKSESKAATVTSLKRQDSGYDSMSDDEDSKATTSLSSSKNRSIPLPTNTTQLEFSNYARIDVKRRGAKSSKRYEFDYWGVKYTWKRVVVRMGSFKEISFHLLNNETSATVAHIVPATMTTAEAQEEDAKGGWVPPCLMWISDESILGGPTHVADVIVAAGLIALVDDSIKNKFHQKRGVQMTLPSLMRSPLKFNKEHVGPKHLLDEVFNRRSSTTSRRATPLRQISADD
ncbi:MAG: hypothetical protein LQ351_005434 [Letrouitia transgressa]|nr:MAG: hypothetical protein LQ351_005434 [Letrouitia transgressa]